MQVSFVSTYAIRCGIATYTNYLGQALSKYCKVKVYCEETDFNVSMPLKFQGVYSKDADINLEEIDGDIIHVQYEPGIFSHHPLLVDRLSVLEQLYSRFPKALTTLHVTLLKSVKGSVICHTKEMAKVVNLPYTIIPHGCYIGKVFDKNKARDELGLDRNKFIVGLFGFVSPTKGHHLPLIGRTTLEKAIPNIQFLYVGGIHPASVGWNDIFITRIRKFAEKYPYYLKVTEFIEDDDTIDKYISACDLMLFPKSPSVYPYVSGALCRVLFAGKPIITSKDIGYMFIDLPRVNVNSSDAFNVEFINLVRGNLDKYAHLAKNYAHDNSWDKVALKHLEVYSCE